AVLVGRAAEMPVGRRALIDRPVEFERAADVCRSEPEQLGQNFLELFLLDLACAVGINQHRHRVSDADSIGDLDRAALGDAGSYKILGKIARSIGCRTVDLGRILSGERTTTVGRVATVRVDDDLTAGKTTITVRSADHEVAGRVDQEVGWLLRHPSLRERGLHGVRDHLLDQAGRIFLAVAALRIVLRRYHDLGTADWFTVDVTNGDLALRIGLQVVELAGTALFRQNLEDLVREIDRRRHEGVLLVDLALSAGKAEHHALVAGTFFFSALLL